MSDFKWEMQERIDRGMNPDEAYYATRESYADAADLARKRAKEDRAPTCPECESARMSFDDHVWACPKCGYEGY